MKRNRMALSTMIGIALLASQLLSPEHASSKNAKNLGASLNENKAKELFAIRDSIYILNEEKEHPQILGNTTLVNGDQICINGVCMEIEINTGDYVFLNSNQEVNMRGTINGDPIAYRGEPTRVSIYKYFFVSNEAPQYAFLNADTYLIPFFAAGRGPLFKDDRFAVLAPDYNYFQEEAATRYLVAQVKWVEEKPILSIEGVMSETDTIRIFNEEKQGIYTQD